MLRSFGSWASISFDVRDLFPGWSDQVTAEEPAAYFNKISQEFDPLKASDMPITYNRGMPVLICHMVLKRVKKFRKPKSMIFPDLMTHFSDFFSIPLTSIYNKITVTKQWPACWKEEFVTIILKKAAQKVCLIWGTWSAYKGSLSKLPMASTRHMRGPRSRSWTLDKTTNLSNSAARALNPKVLKTEPWERPHGPPAPYWESPAWT